MADEAVEQPIRWEWRYALGVLVLLFNALCIGWCLLYGKSDNLLHQNALSWSYILSGGILAGLGIGASLPQITQIMSKK